MTNTCGNCKYGCHHPIESYGPCGLHIIDLIDNHMPACIHHRTITENEKEIKWGLPMDEQNDMDIRMRNSSTDNWIWHGWQMDGLFDKIENGSEHVLYAHNGMLIITDFEPHDRNLLMEFFLWIIEIWDEYQDKGWTYKEVADHFLAQREKNEE